MVRDLIQLCDWLTIGASFIHYSPAFVKLSKKLLNTL